MHNKFHNLITVDSHQQKKGKLIEKVAKQGIYWILGFRCKYPLRLGALIRKKHGACKKLEKGFRFRKAISETRLEKI